MEVLDLRLRSQSKHNTHTDTKKMGGCFWVLCLYYVLGRSKDKHEYKKWRGLVGGGSEVEREGGGVGGWWREAFGGVIAVLGGGGGRCAFPLQLPRLDF